MMVLPRKDDFAASMRDALLLMISSEDECRSRVDELFLVTSFCCCDDSVDPECPLVLMLFKLAPKGSTARLFPLLPLLLRLSLFLSAI